MYKQLKDVTEELKQLRENGIVKGKYVGWDWNTLPFTVLEGKTTYIGAAPASGKTEIWFEFLINLSCKYEWNHIIYSPETGTASDIFSELCYKFIGKPYVKSNGYEMEPKELLKAEHFIGKHFIIVDPVDEDLTLEQFYELCDRIEIETNKKYHTTTIDPWNELTENYLPQDLGREDKYLSRILGIVRRNARKTNRHNCIITHVRDQAPITRDGKTFFPMPTARDFAGGQTWNRKGFNTLIIWRPPYGLLDETGRMYEENEVHVHVAKVKPKGTAKKGIYKMFLDTSRYQYYFESVQNQRIYADRKLNTYQHVVEIKEALDLSQVGRQVNEFDNFLTDEELPF